MTVEEAVNILIDKVLIEGVCSADVGVAIRTVAHALGFYRPEGCQDTEYVQVIQCKDCILGGHCSLEDTFSLAGIENPFCCVGKRKEGDGNEP